MNGTVAIISGRSMWGVYLKNLLEEIFEGSFDIKIYGSDNNTLFQPIDAQLVIFSKPILFCLAQKYIKLQTPVIGISHTISKEQYKKICAIPAGKEVLVVNDSEMSIIETIQVFHALGINHIDFVPYAEGVEINKNIDTAITPGEKSLVPSYIKNVVDIGERLIDSSSITEIAMYMGLEKQLYSDRVKKYFDSLMPIKSQLYQLFDKSRHAASRIEGLLSMLDDGVIIADENGIIIESNKDANRLLTNSGTIIGKHISEFMPEINKLNPDSDGELLIKRGGRYISLRIVKVNDYGMDYGFILQMSYFEEREKKQNKLRRQIMGKGHFAKYCFNDIITQNKNFYELKKLAQTQAKNNATILITGESGTGKEMFAQAIHNASNRKDGPFVAINCAALPQNLLESELFGYEEGSFTGAKKGGKIGLFEMAHRGTIFLDEIGDMDSALQARLLRVLEEREVMRIGGDRVIPVDIRVIAATNRNLWEMSNNGGFRKDLYYRLNVFPFELPPLRKRKDDIMLLFSYIMDKNGKKFNLSNKAKELMLSYRWYGNVRELKNCVDYLCCLEKSTIDLDDLKRILHFSDDVNVPEHDIKINETKFNGEFLKNIPAAERKCAIWIIKYLYNNGSCGRRKLFQMSVNENFNTSESLIRSVLTVLQNEGIVVKSVGRGGTALTDFGYSVAENV